MALPDAEALSLWAVAGFIVVFSILFHGTTVQGVMRRLDKGRVRG